MNSLKNKSDKLKKNYIQPQVTASIRYSLEKPLCGSFDKATWGGTSGNFANPNWLNEGHTDEGDYVGIQGNAGTINSQTKGRGGDWGSIW